MTAVEHLDRGVIGPEEEWGIDMLSKESQTDNHHEDGGFLLEEAVDVCESELITSHFATPDNLTRRINRLNTATVFEETRVKASQYMHGFGDRKFWLEMMRPVHVETSLGTEHKVRIVGQERLLEQGESAKNVLIINPLGTSSAGGYMAELAHIFYEAGFVVWNVSPPGFEGKLPIGEAVALDVKKETKFADESLESAAEKLGIVRPPMFKFGGSQGGGITIGMHYRDIESGREPLKAFGVSPSSGHNTLRPRVLLEYARQFLLDEPRAGFRHIRNHPEGFLKRGKQLAGTLNFRPGALMQVVGGAVGLILRDGHEKIIADSFDSPEMHERYFNGDVFTACLSKDIVARAKKWPGAIEVEGYHLDLVDEIFALLAIEFFEGKRTKQEIAEFIEHANEMDEIAELTKAA